MKGSKTKRGENSWLLRIYDGVDPVTGKKKYLRETFIGSENKADNRLQEIIVDRNRGEYVEPSKVTFGEYLLHWIDTIKNTISDGTSDDYNNHIKNHILKDKISQIQLIKLNALDIQGYLNRKIGAPRADKRTGGISAKSVSNQLGTIKKALKDACIWRILKENPAQYVSPPKVPKVKMSVFSEEEAVRFLEAATDDRFYLLFLTAIYTGLRQGELRGLTWDNLNLNNCTMSIQQIVRKSGKKAIYKEPKTDGSIAQVSFEPEFIPLFEFHRKQQIENRLKFGAGYEEHNLVFCSYNGRPIDLKILDKHFNQVIKKAHVSEIRFHDLRHSCATILISAGVHLKTVQERLRHKDIRTTGNIYSHVIPSMQKEANVKMGNALKIKGIDITSFATLDDQKDDQFGLKKNKNP